MKERNKDLVSCAFNIVLYIITYLLIQMFVTFVATFCFKDTGMALTMGLTASTFLSVALFAHLEWADINKRFIRTRPWALLLAVALFSLGLVVPSELITEWMNVEMPENQMRTFEMVMGSWWGYLAIGLFAPLAEEVLFRGAVLREALDFLEHHKMNYHWWAIGISALLFAVIHGNLAQGGHAFIIGLLLGWLFYRTRSIIPGLILHWVNNTVAFILYQMMPDKQDGKLIDLFQGDQMMVNISLGTSLVLVCVGAYIIYKKIGAKK